jgi:hypothetical protein
MGFSSFSVVWVEGFRMVDLEPREYRYTQGVRKIPAKNNRIPATCMGVKTTNPRFMRMKELPQIQPSRMIKNRGNHLNFTLQK